LKTLVHQFMRNSLLRTSLLVAMTLFLALTGPRVRAAQDITSIFGTVWNDADCSHVLKPADVFIGNVTVTLLDSNNKVVQTTTTDSTVGFYSFLNINTGTYTVQVTVPAGFVASNALPGNATDSHNQIIPGSTATVVNLTTLKVPATVAQVSYAGNDFLVCASTGGGGGPSGCIEGVVFVDNNNNGKQDTGEKSLANVTVTLEDKCQKVLATTTTDANGNYSFGNLADGDYLIKVPCKTQDLKVFSYCEATKVANGACTTKDFRYHGGCISGHIVCHRKCDEGDDERDDEHDKAICHVKVELKDCDGHVICTEHTDEHGCYSFQDCLKDGDYHVCVSRCLTTHCDRNDGSEKCDQEGDEHNCNHRVKQGCDSQKVSVCDSQESKCHILYHSCGDSHHD
jgi:hypothetical protein